MLGAAVGLIDGLQPLDSKKATSWDMVPLFYYENDEISWNITLQLVGTAPLGMDPSMGQWVGRAIRRDLG